MGGGGDGEDRLSDLCDDLLRRILYFAPSKVAASTSVLSRRWCRGSLWRSTGAVNLAVQAHAYQTRRYPGTYSTSKETGHDAAFFSAQDAFVRAADAALAAAEVPVTRLTLRVESTHGESTVERFLCHGRVGGGGGNVVGALLSHPAARQVEELRVAAVDVSTDGAFLCLEKENHRHTGIYALALASLPSSSETLRVLDLTRCTLTTSPAALAFPLPRLATVRLRHCAVEDKVLQAMLDAAPELTTVRLESLFFLLPRPDELAGAEAEPSVPAVLRLSFPAVTTLVMSLCGKEPADRRRGKSSWGIEIDAPRLQSFRYKGLMRRFILRPPATATATPPGVVARVDLHFLRDYDDEKETRRELFWQFVRNFTSARTLKLKVGNDLLKDIAAIGEEARHDACAFPSLERLELEGMHRPKIKTAAAAIASLLHCCPALCEIVLKLSDTVSVTALPDKDPLYGREFLGRKGRLGYSIDDDDVPGIPGLSGRSFACLQRTLRRVGLQFRLDNSSVVSSCCLGLRLVKFFADHGSVLEEICVDTGNWRLNEHLSFTRTVVAPMSVSATTSSYIQKKNLADSSSEIPQKTNNDGLQVLVPRKLR